jgi:FkbM family methyltransferase
MFNLKNIMNSWLAKRSAKRNFREYPTQIETFHLKDFGDVRFANWKNPLVLRKTIDDGNTGFFKKIIAKGDTVLDIGANIGHMTIPMALAAGTEGCCIAFDPNPIVFKILTQNASLNPDCTHIQGFNCAITSEETEFYYHSSEASFNNGGISTDLNSRHGKYVLPEKVKGIVLESFLEQNFQDRLSKLKLIKIDTEGYDRHIVSAIKDLILTYRPFIISECFGRMPAEDKLAYFDLLKEMHYRLEYFSDFTENAHFESIERSSDMLKWKHFDFLATPVQ